MPLSRLRRLQKGTGKIARNASELWGETGYDQPSTPMSQAWNVPLCVMKGLVPCPYYWDSC